MFVATSDDGDSLVVLVFVLAFGSRTRFPLRRFAYAHIPQPGEARGELLAFAFTSILVVFTFGRVFVVFSIRSCLVWAPPFAAFTVLVDLSKLGDVAVASR